MGDPHCLADGFMRIFFLFSESFAFFIRRFIDGESNHFSQSILTRVAKQLSLGNIGSTYRSSFWTDRMTSSTAGVTSSPLNDDSVVTSAAEPEVDPPLPVSQTTTTGSAKSSVFQPQRQVTVEIHIHEEEEEEEVAEGKKKMARRPSSVAEKLTLEACYSAQESGPQVSRRCRRQSMSLELVPAKERRRSPLNTRRVKSYEEEPPPGNTTTTYTTTAVRNQLQLPIEIPGCYGAANVEREAAQGTLEGPARYGRSRRQSMSLEVDPSAAVRAEAPGSDRRRANPLTTRRVKSCEEDRVRGGQQRDYDRNRITQFFRRPIVSCEDPECLTGAGNGNGSRRSAGKNTGGSSRVRYNDTGSFEEVDEEKVELLFTIINEGTGKTGEEGGEGGSAKASRDVVTPPTPPPPMTTTTTMANPQKYRDLWRLRATFEETEEFSDILRMEEITSPEEPSSEEPGLTSLTTSFESNVTEPRTTTSTEPPLKSPLTSRVTDMTSTMTATIPSQEARRQSYRKMITERMANRMHLRSSSRDHHHVTSLLPVIAKPPISESSFDSVDTDGEISDASRQEMTTTSFDSTTTTTTTTTTDNNTDVDNNNRTTVRDDVTIGELSMTSSSGGGGAGGTGGEWRATNEEGVRTLERRTPTTASKKRHQYRNDRRVWQVCESINEVTTMTGEGATGLCPSSSSSAQRKREPEQEEDEEEEEEQEPAVAAAVSSSSSSRTAAIATVSGMTSFSRFLRYHIRRSARQRLRRRDYSVDEKTDALFTEFLRYDPSFDLRTRRSGGSGANHSPLAPVPSPSVVEYGHGGSRRHLSSSQRLETVVESGGGRSGPHRSLRGLPQGGPMQPPEIYGPVSHRGVIDAELLGTDEAGGTDLTFDPKRTLDGPDGQGQKMTSSALCRMQSETPAIRVYNDDSV